MTRVRSFEPIIGCNPRVIILGSMPGVISLNAAQYYANPRNMFWQVVAGLFNIDTDCSYQARVRKIRQLPIILWDTLKACHREGSLDAKIVNADIEANDIVALLEQYPSVRAIAFNGAAAAKYFDRLVRPNVPGNLGIELLKMPSTSPANARMGFEQKLGSWKRLLAFI